MNRKIGGFCALTALLASALTSQTWSGDQAVALQVSDSKGRPVDNARVVFTFQGTPGESGPDIVGTDSRGRAVVAKLAPGPWQVEVNHPEYLSYIAMVDIRRGKKPLVSASFLEAGGRSLAPVRVKFSKGDNQQASPVLEARAPVEPQAPQTSIARAPEPPATPSAESTQEPTPSPPPPTHSPESTSPDPVTQVARVNGEGVESTVDPVEAPEPVEKTPVAETTVSEPIEAAPPAVEPPVPETTVSEPIEAASPVVQPPVPKATVSEPIEAASPAVEPQVPKARVSEPAEAVSPPAVVAAPVEMEEPTVASPEAPAPSVGEPRVEPSPEIPQPAPPAPSPIEAVAPAAEQAAEVPTPLPTPSPVAPPVAARWAAPPPPDPGIQVTSHSEGSCAECESAEWTLRVSVAVPAMDPGSQGRCDAEILTATQTAMKGLATSIQLELDGFIGPVADGTSQEAVRRAESDLAEPFQQPLAAFLGGESPCQVVGLVLPKIVRFSRVRYAASDQENAGDCEPGQTCVIGDAQWLGSARVERGPSATIVYALFENRSTERGRRAILTAYYRPPNANWRPRLPVTD